MRGLIVLFTVLSLVLQFHGTPTCALPSDSGADIASLPKTELDTQVAPTGDHYPALQGQVATWNGESSDHTRDLNHVSEVLSGSLVESAAAVASQETPGLRFTPSFKDPNEVDPRTPDPTHPAFQKPFPPINVDVEPIAGGVIRMDLKRLEADAACFCHLPDRIRKLEGSQCLIPHRITVHKDASWQPSGVPEASPALLKRLIGSINEVRLVTSSHSSFADVDGRQIHIDQPRTFGGDMGEFIQVLSFIERKRKRPVTSVEVAQFFLKWISQSRGKGLHEQFYFSTDTTALMRLTQWLRDTYGLHGSQLLDLTNVPAFLARPVLNALQKPAHHGNLSIRLMLEFPDKFKVRPNVAHKLFEAYFNLLWRRDKEFEGELLHTRLQFVVAEGLHKERLFLDVRNSAYCVAEKIHSVLTISKLPPQTRALPNVAPGPARATTDPVRKHKQREINIAMRNVQEMRTQEAEARKWRQKNALPHAKTKGATQRIRKKGGTSFLEVDAEVRALQAQDKSGAPSLPDIANEAAAEVEARQNGNVDDPLLLAAKTEDSVHSILHPESTSYDTKAAIEQLSALSSLESSAAFQTANSHALAEESSNQTKALEEEARRVREEQLEDERNKQELFDSMLETLGYDYLRNPIDSPDVRRHAAPGYPWSSETGPLVGDSRYRPQTGMQAFIFNSQAAENLRQELLLAALSSFKVGQYQQLWQEYSQLTKANDHLFMQLMASGIPSYVVFMT